MNKNMPSYNTVFDFLKNLFYFLLFLLVLGATYLVWGVASKQISLTQSNTITVAGQAETDVQNQIATYSAGVNAVTNTKEEAVNEVNTKVQEVIAAVKTFGVEDKDIKTENLSIYQSEETYTENGATRSRPGQWRASNNISITLRDISRASELAEALAATGANNIYGPSFSLENTQTAETELLQEAVINAMQNAERLAAASGRKLGRVVNIVEGGNLGVSPLVESAKGLGGGGDIPTEPGSSEVNKTVTVTFELR